jgi:hypothetical protein
MLKQFALPSMGGMLFFLLLNGGAAPAPKAASAHVYDIRVASVIEINLQGAIQKVEGDSHLQYSWSHEGNARTLIFHSVSVDAKANGRIVLGSTMSRDKLVTTQNGTRKEVAADDATPDQKRQLRGCFDVPLCRIQVDENGKELKREILAGDDAGLMTEGGLISNAALFHSPFMRGMDSWKADAEVNTGNGVAKGPLTYTKAPSENGRHVVKVSGTLINKEFRMPGKSVSMKDIQYIVTGEQTYDLHRADWIAGTLQMNLSLKMEGPNNAAGTGAGTLDWSFKALPEK